MNSAVTRLRQLDLRKEQETRIGRDWLSAHYHELEAKYGGQVIALWHDPDVDVIANGRDAFELEDNLKKWRAQREESRVQREDQPWEQPGEPYLLDIPAVPRDYQEATDTSAASDRSAEE